MLDHVRKRAAVAALSKLSSAPVRTGAPGSRAALTSNLSDESDFSWPDPKCGKAHRQRRGRAVASKRGGLDLGSRDEAERRALP